MEELGWLTSDIEFQENKPNKRIYSITTKGKEELKRWLSNDLPPDFLPPKSEILIRIFFSAQNSPEENISKLQKTLKAHKLMSEKMEDTIDTVSIYAVSVNGPDRLYWELTADFGKMYAGNVFKMG